VASSGHRHGVGGPHCDRHRPLGKEERAGEAANPLGAEDEGSTRPSSLASKGAGLGSPLEAEDEGAAQIGLAAELQPGDLLLLQAAPRAMSGWMPCAKWGGGGFFFRGLDRRPEEM